LGEQKYILAWLEIEHLCPRAKGGTSAKETLWLACPFCNTFKSSNIRGTDPKTKRRVPLLTRADNTGKIILNSALIKPPSSVKQYVGVRQSTH
jgi:hypothetical protein